MAMMLSFVALVATVGRSASAKVASTGVVLMSIDCSFSIPLTHF